VEHTATNFGCQWSRSRVTRIW